MISEPGLASCLAGRIMLSECVEMTRGRMDEWSNNVLLYVNVRKISMPQYNKYGENIHD